MVPVLNQLGVHCAVFGNHDFGLYPMHVFDGLIIKLCRFWSGDAGRPGVQDQVPVADVQCGGQGDRGHVG